MQKHVKSQMVSEHGKYKVMCVQSALALLNMVFGVPFI